MRTPAPGFAGPVPARGMQMRLQTGVLCRIAIPAFWFASLVGCSQPQSYSSQHFSFPESSKPHEGNWEYLGVVRFPDVKGDALTRPRDVQVRVIDRAKTEVLRDDLRVGPVARPRAVITWPEQGKLTLSIRDAAHPSADGSAKRVLEVTYLYDAKRRTYQRVR